MHDVLVNRLGGLSLPRKSVVRLTDRPDMTLDVYRGRKTTVQLKGVPAVQWVKRCLLNPGRGKYSTQICPCSKMVNVSVSILRHLAKLIYRSVLNISDNFSSKSLMNKRPMKS